MKVLENKNNYVVLENGNYYYLISYNSVIAKVCNVLSEEYGLYLTSLWDYSQTTLKQLYNFIIRYSTQRDKEHCLIGYDLEKATNKKAYIQKQIDLHNIKLVREKEM